MGICFEKVWIRHPRGQPDQVRWWNLNFRFLLFSPQETLYETCQKNFYELQLVTFFLDHKCHIIFLKKICWNDMLLDVEAPCWGYSMWGMIQSEAEFMVNIACGIKYIRHVADIYFRPICPQNKAISIKSHSSGRSPWSVSKPWMMIPCLWNLSDTKGFSNFVIVSSHLLAPLSHNSYTCFLWATLNHLSRIF